MNLGQDVRPLSVHQRGYLDLTSASGLGIRSRTARGRILPARNMSWINHTQASRSTDLRVEDLELRGDSAYTKWFHRVCYLGPWSWRVKFA
jgi:hypothetical protein